MAVVKGQHAFPEGAYLGEKGPSFCLRVHFIQPESLELKGAVDNVGQQLYHLFRRLGDGKRGTVDFFQGMGQFRDDKTLSCQKINTDGPARKRTGSRSMPFVGNLGSGRLFIFFDALDVGPLAVVGAIGFFRFRRLAAETEVLFAGLTFRPTAHAGAERFKADDFCRFGFLFNGRSPFR
jgi:hypothetical protein